MKVNEKTQKLYQQALEIDENEHDQENREKSDSSRDEERKRDEDSSPQTDGNSIRSGTHKAANFEKSSPEGQSSKYKSTDYSSSPNYQQHRPWQKEELKNVPSHSKPEELKPIANNGPEEYKREEHNEHIQIRREHVITLDQTSRHLEKKYTQGSYEQKSEKGKASRKHKQFNEEEAKGHEFRKHQEEVPMHQTHSM